MSRRATSTVRMARDASPATRRWLAHLVVRLDATLAFSPEGCTEPAVLVVAAEERLTMAVAVLRATLARSGLLAERSLAPSLKQPVFRPRRAP